MNKENLSYISAVDLANMIKKQEITAQEITEIMIERIEKYNPIVNAYCTTTFEFARQSAKSTDDKIKKGEKLGIIEGVPTSIKDLTDTAGIRTTMGSKIFEHNIPVQDDLIVKRLKNAGMVMLGKTNTPEFGHKGTTDNLIFGETKNPWNLTRTTGGSSGGAGAATALGLCFLAQGSDGGGSIRTPSSFCGLYGIKPSFGRIPQTSMLTMGNFGTLTQKGPLVRYVRDAALMLDVMVGADDIDRYSLPNPEPGFSFLKGLDEKLGKLKIGYSMDLGGYVKAIDPEVENTALDSVHKFEKLGWTVEKADVEIKNASRVHGIIWISGLSQYLSSIGPSDWEDKLNQLDPYLKRMVGYMSNVNPQLMTWAQVEREIIYKEVCRHFKKFDIFICPTVAVPAFELGKNTVDEINNIDVSDNNVAWMPYTAIFNLTGHPAASIPCGWTKDGLPIGMMIVGKRHQDLTVLQVSQEFENISPWQDKRPSLEG